MSLLCTMTRPPPRVQAACCSLESSVEVTPSRTRGFVELEVEDYT